MKKNTTKTKREKNIYFVSVHLEKGKEKIVGKRGTQWKA